VADSIAAAWEAVAADPAAVGPVVADPVAD
jgi:hypothetical protein